jgi:site-specific DNA recombinase
MRAIGYLSEYGNSQASDDDRASLAQQNDDFLRYCDRHGYQPAAAFLDPQKNGSRPGITQLLDYLDAPDKGFIVVVVTAFTRLGPERPEAARTYFQIVSRGAQVVSVREGPLDDAKLLELWSQHDPNGQLSDRVRDAMRRRAVKGQVLGRPPYGYRVGVDRRLEIVEEEAALVRLIFRLYISEDLGIRLIAKRLNEDGYRTRRDGNWSMVTIRDLLHNRVYVGTYTRFGVKVPGNHAAIVTESDFQAVQERMQQRRRPAAKAKPSRFLLSGLVYYGEGDARMIGVTRRQQWTRRDGEVASNVYRYYQSEARTNQSVGDYNTRRAADLEAEVLSHITGEAEGAVRPAVLTAGDAVAVAAEVAVSESRVRSRMRALDRRLADALTAVSAGRQTPEHLREVAQEITADYQHFSQ